LCKRLRFAAKQLTRRRAGKPDFNIGDEYDVQDLLHAIIRCYLKYSVQEDPISTVAGTKSSRADIAIEELGVLIDLKFVRSPNDQKQLLSDFAEDLVLYSKWPHLKTFVFCVYNSDDLKDPEALHQLSGRKDMSGKVFHAEIVLA
jgi:REase_DpnII-MboI